MHKRPLQGFAQRPAIPVPTASSLWSGTLLIDNDGQDPVRVFTDSVDLHPVSTAQVAIDWHHEVRTMLGQLSQALHG